MPITEIPYRSLEYALPTAGPYVLLKTGLVAGTHRWSMLGWDPWLTWTPTMRHDPCVELDQIIAYAAQQVELPVTDFPLPLLMGALSYDLGLVLEPVTLCADDDLQLPKAVLYGFQHLLVADEVDKRCWSVAVIARRTQAEAVVAISAQKVPRVPQTFSEREYLRAVTDIRALISAGDCYQVNLSQRFVVTTEHAASQLLHEALHANPAPMMALVDTGTFQVISTSPERLIQKDGDRCIAEPIKGTSPCHTDPKALVQSAKNRAELAMIVDLMRNDLGRFAVAGSVEVSDPCRVETYTNVHHLVATVTARAQPATTWGTIFRAIFPGGSVTGCPKIHAMTVIESMEKVRRGYYCGSVGYIDAHGHGDWNIAIRTMTKIGDQAIFHLGGGVTYDSDPDAEYAETLCKGETIFRALHVGPGHSIDAREQRTRTHEY